ncbi:hypothetical protein K3181_08565 [Qipengyuania sp. YG27]|uniref:Uncharacterized protein n=1 Tax=Qipengyuania mesophila TaxID=2867246 RepID=A0ABS7JV98_9SPHN|nr:hypothetical protein [Qipengyuania mesophila]MBX7501493.1 hypothetical protein [Qipengyuania mesophila]
MLKPLAFTATALGLLAMPLRAEEPTQMTRGEAELAKLLEGRVAGEPQRCINTFGTRTIHQIDGTALTYRDGDTVWVNYTRNPDSIDDSDVMVIRRFSATSLCRTDQIEMIERTGGFLTGVLFLDDFVPYTKVDAEG